MGGKSYTDNLSIGKLLETRGKVHRFQSTKRFSFVLFTNYEGTQNTIVKELW